MNKPTTPSEIDAFLKTVPKDQIVSRECKHATYSLSRDLQHDMLTVKEWVTLKDGSRYPTVRLFKDWKRPVWITKEPYRDHPDKIQFEDLKRVDLIKCRQMDLGFEIYQRLHTGRPSDSIKRLSRKPYVYGADFGSEVYLKQMYMDKWKGSFQANKVTVFDAETNVWEPGQKAILWSEVNEEEVILYYSRAWMKGNPNYEDDVREEYYRTLPQYLDYVRKKLGHKKTGKYPEWIDTIEKLPLRFVPGDDHVDITLKMVDHFHLTQPDLITGWNVFFDANVVHEALIDGGYDPADILSDPRVPPEFRLAYLEEGPASKKTANGTEMRLAPQERWHKTLHTASWRISDSQQLYWQLRKAKGKENGGYGLDAVLTRQIGIGKVKMQTEDSDIPSGTIHWHMEMQKKYHVAYGVYSIFDSVGLRIQEYKNNDLTSQISALAGSIDYSQFNSQPKINSVDMHMFALREKGKVLCTTSDQMETEADSEILSRDGWINSVTS